MNLLSWQNITLRKRSWELNICNKFPIGVILRSKKNNMCSGKREKDETGNENMFWFEFEDRVSGEGLKEVGSKWVGRKEVRSWVQWIEKVGSNGLKGVKSRREELNQVALWIQFFGITVMIFLLGRIPIWGVLPSSCFGCRHSTAPLGCCWR